MFEEEKAVESTEETDNVLQEVLEAVDEKWTKQVQKQQYNQYVKFVVMNKKRGAKRKNKK